MSTYRDVIYMVLDYLKLSSDDSYYTEDHVRFLLNKFRAYVLKSKFENDAKNPSAYPSESNFQTLDVNLEHVNGVDGMACTGHYLRSVEEIPTPLFWHSFKIWAGVMFGNNVIMTMPARFRFAGTGRLSKLFNYATIGPDNHLYMKSGNPQMYYLNKVTVKGVFENPEEVYDIDNANASSKGEDVVCDILDREFPLDSSLLALCMQYVVKELNGGIYKPRDSENNAADDLSELANFIRSYAKSPLQRQIYGQ